MNNQKTSNLYKDIISCGKLLWDKDLVTAWNGNISVRVDSRHILITGAGTSLGFLKKEDIVLLNLSGDVVKGKRPSSEKLLHLDIYKSFPQVSAIVHTHTIATNAFFLEQSRYRPSTFEAKFILGDVFSVGQDSINVKDTAPVIKHLKANKIVALGRHGVVSIGEDLFECFARVQTLEEQVKMEAMRVLFRGKLKGSRIKI